MNDRMQPDRNNAPPNRSAPSAPNHEESSRSNGRRDTSGEDTSTHRSSKPALTERERSERWPVG